MKKVFLNTNLFVLLLAPVFLLSIIFSFTPVLHLQMPNVDAEISGLFNQKSLFQVSYDVIKSLIW